jgi:archaemetzincin
MSDKRSNPPTGPARQGLITVIPLGRVQEDVLRVVSDSLQGVLRLPVDVLAPAELPGEAFITTRNQYNAMMLIKYLDAEYGDRGLKVLGVTAKDITNPILTYVFGEAYMDGRSAVMSYRRLALGPAGDPVSREQLLERVVKVAVHEIGHTFNIPHCHEGRCVMKASNTLGELDDKLNYMCGYCEFFLSDALTKALRDQEKEKKRQESA